MTLKKTFIAVLTLLSIIIFSGVFVRLFYGKEVTRYILSEISRSVNVEIRISEAENISLFKKFPFASMTLHEVVIKDILEDKTHHSSDTLLFINKVYLQFNLLDILRKKNQIRRISISGGFVRLKVDDAGNENYKVTKSTGTTDAFLLKLSRMNFADFDFYYTNDLKEQEYIIQCRAAEARGNFSTDEFTAYIKGNFFVRQIKSENAVMLSNRAVDILTEFDINNGIKKHTIKKGEISIDQRLNFNISGTVNEKPGALLPEIKITGKQLDFSSLLEALPPLYKKKLEAYDGKGNISFDCLLSGEYSSESSPAIQATFALDNGLLLQKNSDYSLSSIHLNGTYTNGKKRNPGTTIIEIADLTAVFGKGNSEKDGALRAKITIKDLNHPLLKFSANGNFDLAKLQKFITVDTLENITGEADFSVDYEGRLKANGEYTARDFKNAHAAGNIHCKNVNFSLKQSPLEYRNFSGTWMLDDNDIIVKELKGNISSTDIEFNGWLKNAIGFFFLPDEKLVVEASVFSENINLNELLTEEAAEDTTYVLAFPAHVDFNLKAEAGSLSFRKFSAKELSGIITLRDNKLHSDLIRFKTMEGTVSGTLDIDASSPEAIIISSRAKINQVNIQTLFADLENFGQTVITERHLKGIATADVLFSMMLDSALNVNENNIRTLTDLTVDKGELINFEPMDDISGFIKNHAFLKRVIKTDEFEKKLKHIRFASLKNQVEIRDKMILFPAMTIQSSAMNIDAEGVHGFDNSLDYRINFLLSELLTKKEEVSQEEFGEVEEDGSGKKKVFLTIKGTLDKPEITYDKKKVKKNMQEEAKKEKNQVKGILKEEFGWFKKDTAAVYKKEEKKEDFAIIWDESPAAKAKTGNTVSDTTSENKKENNFQKLLDKIGKEEKKNKEEDFEFEKTEDF